MTPRREEESSGFCIVDSSDCAETCAADTAEFCPAAQRPKKKEEKSRVRFNVDDTDGADTEDYNADADTDEFDADTTDVDTDLNATDHDGDTEGYCADADDTDNYGSDLNEFKMVPSSLKSKKNVISDIDDSSDQQQAINKTHKLSVTEKRGTKKKNKKSKGKNHGNQYLLYHTEYF